MYCINLPPAILCRGFWLYGCKIVGPQNERICYIGMTGDTGSGVAQSPYVRFAAHLGYNNKNNAIRKYLGKRRILPENCLSITLSVYGPILPYKHKITNCPGYDYKINRRRVAALECKLWLECKNAGNDMLNRKPASVDEFEQSLWEGVPEAFSSILIRQDNC